MTFPAKQFRNLTMREQMEAISMQEVKRCRHTKNDRLHACFICSHAPQCPWCLEEW